MWKEFSIMLSCFGIALVFVLFWLLTDFNNPINNETIYNTLYFLIVLNVINILFVIGHSLFLRYEKKKKLIEEGYLAEKGLT